MVHLEGRGRRIMSSSPECAKHWDHHLKKGGNRNKQFSKELKHGKQFHTETSSSGSSRGRHKEPHRHNRIPSKWQKQATIHTEALGRRENYFQHFWQDCEQMWGIGKVDMFLKLEVTNSLYVRSKRELHILQNAHIQKAPLLCVGCPQPNSHACWDPPPVCFVLLWPRVSCVPHWPQTYYVAQDDLDFIQD